jgi:hypothetical protein
VTRRGLRLVALACAAFFASVAFAAPGPVLPASVTNSLLGPKLIRGEIVVRGKERALHDYRLDRGKLSKRFAAGSLTLLERDGTKVVVKVAPTARAFLNGKPAGLRQLRAGMQIAVTHDGDLPADSVYATGARQTPKWPAATVKLLFGAKLVRAEFFVTDTAQHDYRLDHGKIRQTSAYQVVLREPDGTDVTVDISPNAHVKLNNRDGTFLQLRKGMMATTMRDGDKPADQVYATGK